MPICEADPWRMQYFEGVDCPADVNVPTEDGDAWLWYPEYKWVYNKLAISESQGFACGPHGIEPPSFPVFSKPVFNMRGMGTGSRIMRNLTDYKTHQKPGHFWTTLLEGEHVSTDVAVVNGEAKWWRHTTGEPLKGGMFDYWTVLDDDKPEIEAYCGDWLRKNLAGYTGMANFETIGALRRPVAGPVWRQALGRCAGRPVPGRGVELRRFRAAGRLQRRAVRRA